MPDRPSFPQALFFDVDGVLIDSLRVKGESFAAAFADFPGSRDAIVAYHLANGGVNRVEKVTSIFTRLTGRPPTPRELDERVRAFTSAVVDQVVAAPEIAGAGAAVRGWTGRAPLHAVSATPHDELIVIFERRGLLPSFTSIHGWPPKKTDLLPTLVQDLGYQPGRCILVGDSSEDEAAARAAGVLFIRVGPAAEAATADGHPVIADLTALNGAISTLATTVSQ